MPISVGDGFTVGNDQPVDARFTLANSTERFSLATDNVFEGLTVYQTGSGVEGYFILTDLSNYANINGWTEIPLGPGASGSSGTSGTSGENGADGTSGSSGTSGLSGSSGTSGTSGSSGTSGTSGSSGTSGTSGSSGTSGTSGSSGTSGTSGSSGTSGTSGSSGTSGENGADGANGTSGTSGTSGSSGTSGENGADGTSGTSGSSGLLNLTGTTQDGVITYDGTGGGVVNANLNFDGTLLDITGEVTISDTIEVPNMPTGVDNSVVIKDSDNVLKTDEIDSRVWAGSLISLEPTGGGGSGQYRIPTFTSTVNTITGSGNFTFDGTEAILSGILAASTIKITSQGASSAGAYGPGSRILYDNVSSPDPISAGYVYYYNSAAWGSADADNESTSKGWMAVATAAAAAGDPSDGMLLEGPVYMATDPGGSAGDPVYLSTAVGRLTSTQPGTGKIVRIMGYKISTNVVYFNPSPDYIKKA